MPRLIAQPQGSARTQSVATNRGNFVYGLKTQSLTKVSTESEPVVRTNNLRRVLIQSCSIRNHSLARLRVQSLGPRRWAVFTVFIPGQCSKCGQE